MKWSEAIIDIYIIFLKPFKGFLMGKKRKNIDLLITTGKGIQLSESLMIHFYVSSPAKVDI